MSDMGCLNADDLVRTPSTRTGYLPLRGEAPAARGRGGGVEQGRDPRARRRQVPETRMSRRARSWRSPSGCRWILSSTWWRGPSS